MNGNPTPGGLAKALYSNIPEAKNELLFKKGDILTVIEYDYDGQPGWWLCSHRGQRVSFYRINQFRYIIR